MDLNSVFIKEEPTYRYEVDDKESIINDIKEEIVVEENKISEVNVNKVSEDIDIEFQLDQHNLENSIKKYIIFKRNPNGIKLYKDITNEESECHIYKHICEVCGFTIFSKHCLEEHLRTHTGQSYSHMSALGNHKKLFRRKFTCQCCKKEFTSKVAFYKHISRRLRSRYACPLCKKRFKFNRRIRSHMNQHSKGKKYICRTCGKQFITRYLIKQHLLTHKHKCENCGEVFRTRPELTAHIKQLHIKTY